jgi:cytochrome c biogenesis protein CcmG/thiol:disulfide interchange protein DsbE
MDKRYWASLVLLTALAACSGAASSNAVAAIGKPAPPWTDPLASGGTLTMASLVGHPVYLNFFATWCPPCNDEASSVNAIAKRFAPQGLRVVGVDVMENANKAKMFVAEHHLIYPAVVDSGVLQHQYEINGMPVHVFIDRHGIVRKIAIGELSEVQMKKDVRAIL